MAKFDLRQEAIKLRRAGTSIGTIAKTLSVSKSTASRWCSDIKLSKQEKQTLLENAYKNNMRGRLIGAEMNRQKKIKATQAATVYAEKLVGSMKDRDVLISLASLYWAEGSKSDATSGFRFTNSDPKMVYFVKQALEKVLKVPTSDFVCTIQINIVHKPRIEKILKFWSKLLQLPPSQFNKPSFIHSQSKKVYENYDTYFGILRLGVRKSSSLKYRMMAVISAMAGKHADIAQVVRASHS